VQWTFNVGRCSVQRMETGHIRLSWVVGMFAFAVGDPLSLDARDLHSPRQGVCVDLNKPEPRALPPVRSRANFEAFIRAGYPQLTRQKVAGTPVFRVLFDPHGCVARARLDIFRGTADDIMGSADPFESVARHRWQLQYPGVGTAFATSCFYSVSERPTSVTSLRGSHD
jgi:hypothetical protein